ncbi:MAG TPA: twin-arginine translocase TatA/TatE family subunit [Terriglobia bacterium]|nr:twin-arginine translocase TatA/TatE family subunit [Terriglobia bacterium]
MSADASIKIEAVAVLSVLSRMSASSAELVFRAHQMGLDGFPPLGSAVSNYIKAETLCQAGAFGPVGGAAEWGAVRLRTDRGLDSHAQGSVHDSGTAHLLDKQRSVPYYAKERYVLFSGGFTEVGFILFIAFLLFGPKKLPEIARVLGKGMGELRRASNELKSSLEEEIRNLDRKDEEVSYSEPETHPYIETEEESYEHPEDVTHRLSDQSEGDLEPVSEYGHDYSEPPQQEPEPRPRG